jgi:hypothetical protein
MTLVSTVTWSMSANSHAYIFMAELSVLNLERLKTKRVLGMSFEKEKFEFLNDLRDVLTEEILQHLIALSDKEGEK